MMVIILQNGYKGIVISDITAPLQENRISTYEEARNANFTILTRNTLVQNAILLYYAQAYIKNYGLNESYADKLVRAERVVYFIGIYLRGYTITL